ncbi:F-box only protein 24-like [Megalops cyprinoides]|uniref:F-box only protein 24-like n=1 Tax=Megalops cyprinoides TaxID=118141 RepID=UPI001864C131|nr:F-box only protein 24-like [Megalops cyprinoides]
MDDSPEKETRKRPPDPRHKTAGSSTSKKRRTATSTANKDAAARTSIESLPPEMLEDILSRVSVGDIIAFGATCHAFHHLSLSPSLWRTLCRRQAIGPRRSTKSPTNWKRTAILKYSQALYLQTLGGSGIGRGAPCVSRAITPPQALGFKQILPTCDNHFLWDDQGTVFMLYDSVTLSSSGQLVWSEASRHSVLCHNVKDFTVDPRSDVSHRQYVYVLVTRPPAVMEGAPPSWQGPLENGVTRKRCDCVEIYHQYSGERVFHMTFHPSLTFTQLRLMGPEVNRTLLLLTDSGKVYTVPLNETQLDRPRSFTVQLTLKEISNLLPELPVKQIHTSYSSVLYVTVNSSVYVETHSPGVHRQLFGTLQGFNTHSGHTPTPIPLPHKVVKCSLGLSHLCLLDESGHVFMQGSNNHGQLGTGDKIDRREPTQVVLSLTPVDVWCGLNHSLALLQGETGEKEVQGCGCGRGGRLPGWSQGSPVFVRLSVKAPRSTRALCSSKYYIYLLCCHDIEELPLFCSPQPAEGRRERAEEEAEREGLRRCLSQIRECGLPEQLAKLREAVQRHMTLSPSHKEFLEEALTMMEQGPSSTSVWAASKAKAYACKK